LLPFELASILLLMALVGAIILARREFLPDDTSTLQPQRQVFTLAERPREAVPALSGSRIKSSQSGAEGPVTPSDRLDP